eukprot:143242_1
MNFLYLALIVLPFYSPTHSQWVSHPNNTIPRDDTMSAIGTYNGSIYLFGGFNRKQQKTIYDVRTDTFVFYRSAYIPHGNKVFGEAQFWTQIGSNLYILDDFSPLQNKISVFNMQTNTYIPEFDIMPISMSDGMGRACITSYKNSIYINGGITDTGASRKETK